MKWQVSIIHIVGYPQENESMNISFFVHCGQSKIWDQVEIDEIIIK